MRGNIPLRPVPPQVRSLNTNNFTVIKDTLPPETEIIMLKVVREGDL
jgi:hypothetical protein